MTKCWLKPGRYEFEQDRCLSRRHSFGGYRRLLLRGGLSKDDFIADKRTRQAVVMSLIIVGEAASKLVEQDASMADRHPEIPWRAMRGMRNRIAHGYFDINLDVVWDTVQTALPALLEQLRHVADDSQP